MLLNTKIINRPRKTFLISNKNSVDFWYEILYLIALHCNYVLLLNNKLNRFTKFLRNRMKIVKLWILCIDEFTCNAINTIFSAIYPMIIVIFFNFFGTYHFYMCLLVKFSKRKERWNVRITMKLITVHIERILYMHTTCEPSELDDSC